MARKMTPAEVKKAMGLNQPTQKVKCYGEIMHFKNRQAAMDFFLEGINSCDPNSSESDRYVKIYTELACGRELPSDEE